MIELHPEFLIKNIGEKIHEKFFEQVAIELILQKYQVSLLVVDINKEEIIKWTS
ncbi:element excision factor XisH family protein [Aphanizomenon sp. CS-733/32]|uniref:element excision factor XisH family protein n=1 Tax=Aphanizomenon sp. CS-733/32 TaxID=3021715 RepID=UPI00232C0BEB|nr:element excision factor XisH family protein [Aphanizomenon sp. CS-733/32]MDB9309253.1 element excision factor XisH family protein [Aphanizomenon sp. CS-733/32]